MSERIAFAEVPPDEVDGYYLQVALYICGRASRELGVGVVDVVWITPADPAEDRVPIQQRYWSENNTMGMVRESAPGTIFLCADVGWRLGVRALVRTTAHEVRHLWQAREAGGWDRWWQECRSPKDRAEQEADATAYAEDLAVRLEW